MSSASSEGGKPETLLLPDKSCDLTLGGLMEAEGLGYDDAVDVMMRFRKEAGLMSPDANPKAAPGTLPVFAKPSKKKPASDTAAEDPDEKPAGLLKKGSQACLAEEPEQSKAKDKRKHQDPEASSSAAKQKKTKEDAGGEQPASSKPTSKRKANKETTSAEQGENMEEVEEKPKKTKGSKKKEESEEHVDAQTAADRSTGLRKLQAKENLEEADDEEIEREWWAWKAERDWWQSGAENLWGFFNSEEQEEENEHVEPEVEDPKARAPVTKQDIQTMINEIDAEDNEPTTLRRRVRFKQPIMGVVDEGKSNPDKSRPQGGKDPLCDWPHDRQPDPLSSGWFPGCVWLFSWAVLDLELCRMGTLSLRVGGPVEQCEAPDLKTSAMQTAVSI